MAKSGERRAISRLASSLLAFAVDDASAVEVVGRERDLDPVSWDNADIVLTHLARQVSKDPMAIFQLDPEHGLSLIHI